MLVLCIVLLSLFILTDSHTCGYREWSSLTTDHQKTRRRSTSTLESTDTWQPLRMKFMLNERDSCRKKGQKVLNGEVTCKASDVLTDGKRKTLKRIMASAAGWLHEIFKIRASEQPVGPLLLSQGECYNVRIPSCATTEGIDNADYLGIVTVVPDSPGESTNGWAVPCREDQFGRRIAGRINISPSMLLVQDLSLSSSGYTNQRIYHDYTYTAIHEIFHTLGFNQRDFGDPRRTGWYRSVSTNIPITQTINEVTYITTPKVIEKAKLLNNNSADCIHGVPLTRTGGDGTKNTHWDYAFIGHEVMAPGGVGYVPVTISTITLGFFEDTGFYKVDYEAVTSKAPTYFWNQEKERSCGMDLSSMTFSCTGPGFCTPEEALVGSTCSADLTSIAYCFRDGISDCANTKGSNTLCVEDVHYSNSYSSRCFTISNKPHCFGIRECTSDYYVVQTSASHPSKGEKCFKDQTNQYLSNKVLCQPYHKVCGGWTGTEEQLKDQNVSDFFVTISDSCDLPEPKKTKQGCSCLDYWETATDHCATGCCQFRDDNSAWCYVSNPECESGRTYGYCTNSGFMYKRLIIGVLVLVCFCYLAYSVYEYFVKVKTPKETPADVEPETTPTVLGDDAGAEELHNLDDVQPQLPVVDDELENV